MDEFSELLARVPTKVLWDHLMTQPQRNQAHRLWHPKGIDVPAKGVVPDDLRNLRPFMDQVVKDDHARQWEEAEKQGKLGHTQ